MALAGAIVPGVARYIVVLSAHADVFGGGIMTMAGSMLVPPGCVMSCWIVPGGGFAGICGVESGKAAPLVGGPPGMVLQTVIEGLPSRDAGEMVPVVLMTPGARMVPNDVGIIMDGETGLATVDGAGTGIGAREGGGGGVGVGGCGAGIFVPKKSDVDDVAGCADSVR